MQVYAPFGLCGGVPDQDLLADILDHILPSLISVRNYNIADRRILDIFVIFGCQLC